MRVSLVTACRNAAPTLQRTFDSVRMQQYPDLQYIVVDGASTDDTNVIINNNLDLISYYISEPDRGVAQALNKGFKKADGEIYGYINADDRLAGGVLHQVADFFSRNPSVDVITGACRRIFADGSTAITQVRPKYLNELAWRNGLEQPSTFWRSSAHQTAGEFDEAFELAFDWEYWNRLKCTGARFETVTEIMSHYYFSSTNLTSRGGLKAILEMRDITARYHGPGLAAAYMLIFQLLDMRGYLDSGGGVSGIAKAWTRLVFAFLSIIFGKAAISNYNWNWASKQIRGKIWYK